MTTCNEVETGDNPGLPRPRPARLIRLLLFFMMQGAAVILAGFASLVPEP